MQNGHDNNRAQPHEENNYSADAARAVMTSNEPHGQPLQQPQQHPPPLNTTVAPGTRGGNDGARSPSGHSPVFAAPPGGSNNNSTSAHHADSASVNSPFFHLPRAHAGSAYSFDSHPEGRHPTFAAREESEDVFVMEGKAVDLQKQTPTSAGPPAAAAAATGGADGVKRRHASRHSDGAAALYSPTGNESHHGKNNNFSSNSNNPRKGNDPANGDDGSNNEDNGNNERDPQLRFSESFRNQSYVKELPDHLVPLAHEIHQLDDDDLAYISEVTHTMANRDLYSLLPYTGSNWFLPSIRECDDGEKHWDLHYDWKEGLIIAIGGRRLSLRLLNVFIRVCFIVLIWFMLWNMLPRWLVEPGGYVWDPAVLVVVSAIVGGLVCRIVQMPPLVGVLWMGIMWNNIPTLRYLTSGIVKEVFDICSKLGLTVILARAGYKLAVKEIIPHWKQTALLATLPFAFEGVSHSLIANKIFDYNDNYNWAFLQGMLCSIVSPAVVVPGSLYLQDLGYGRGVGPLSLMLSAVGVEIVIGVWCANFIIGLIFYDQKLVVAIILGPVQFIGGIIIGIALGVLFYYIVELIKQEADRLPNGKYTRQHLNSCMDFSYCIFLFACYTMVFLGYKVSLAGGGCVMCVFFAATVAHMWTRTGKAEHEDHKKYVAHWLALTWDQAMMPVLFATMGAKINVKAIFNASFFPKAIICMACSTAVRIIVIFAVQLGGGMPYKEKLLVCVGYLGKASAQASVGPIAANLVANMVAALPADKKGSLDTLAEYANNVQQISAMYVMFMACVASFGLVRGGQLVLKREGTGKKDKKNKADRSSSGDVNAPEEPTETQTRESTADCGAKKGTATRGTMENGGSRVGVPEGGLVRQSSRSSDHHVSFATFEPLHDDVEPGVASNRDRAQ